MQSNKVIIIAGPTASGKSALAIDIALAVNGVVINADSMQVYKDMPIISAAPTAEDKAKVDHRLYEIYDPSFRGNVVDWLKLATEEIRKVWAEGKMPVVVGGTGLYIENLIKGTTPIPQTPDKIRNQVQKLIDEGLYPYTKRYLGTLRNHFSTIGVNGINEMIRNFTNDEHSVADAWGQEFAVKFLDYIRARLVKMQEETGHMYNLEATPAESATYRFAREDKKRYAGIIQAGTAEDPYYTNSSQLPVGYTDDPFEALDLQSTLQTKYTGGTVLHLYMNQRISSAAVCRDLVRRVLTNYRLPYITITPTFSICPKHGYLNGEHKFCPICDEEKKAEKLKALKATNSNVA